MFFTNARFSGSFGICPLAKPMTRGILSFNFQLNVSAF
jgi:hypothetical protein